MSHADDLRRLALEEVLVLVPPGDANTHANSMERLASLSPAERERTMQLALRRLAFQVLFELDVTGAKDASGALQILERVEDLGPMDLDRVIEVVKGAFEERAEADAKVLVLAPTWPTHRQPAVDRALMRLAHYELKHKKLDHRIIINECVEIAKRFSTEKSPGFVNALLDKIAKTFVTAST
jgi:N utilization substance protein B